jgi:serine/threonine-protein kinase
MPYPIQEFWKLAVESQLYSPEECQRLTGSFSQIKGAMETGNAFTLSEWLISQRVLTRYQAKVLLARRPGPFVYGEYKVQDRIDSGRLQGLFRAIHIATRHPVCLCFLSGPQLHDPPTMARLKQTLAAAANVQHPHVMRLYQLVDLEAYKFAVLPDLQGRSLDEFLNARGAFPTAEACRLARQAALGLAELHKNGQVHGEIRPENLWLDAANNVKLLGLPLSRDPLAGPSTVAAADYVAPELASNRWPPTPLSDLYALGCTLYHLLTGQPPFPGGDAQEKLRRQTQEQPPLANQVNPQVPPPVAQVVAYLMAKDPASRYQQASHAADALSPYIDPKGREPVTEPVNAQGRAYEDWLSRQQPPSRAAVVAPAAPVAAVVPPPQQIPVAAAAPPVMAPAAVYSSIPVAAPVMTAAVAQPAVAVQAAPAFMPMAAPASSAVAASRSSLAEQRSARRQQERHNKLIIGVGSGVLALVVAFLLWSGSRKPKDDVVEKPIETPPTTVAATSKGGVTTPAARPVEPVVAIPAAPPEEPIVALGEPLWESPTNGPRLDFQYLPGNAQMFLSLRPAEIWANADGRLVLTSLGVEEFVRQQLVALSGTEPDNIEHAILAFAGAGMGKPPSVSLVARTVDRVEDGPLKNNWNATDMLQVDGKTLYQNATHTFYAPAEAQNKLLVAVPIKGEAEVATWLTASRSPPPLAQKLEWLSRFSDRQRHLTLLVSPAFLNREGRPLMVGTLGSLLEPTQNFLLDESGMSPAAVMASAHLSKSHLFLELRTHDGSPELAKLYKSRVDGLQQAVRKFKTSLQISPYSAEILDSYPRFFEWVQDNTRVGTNEKQVVMRTVLPPMAASNLAFGTHLALLESGGGGATAVNTPNVPQVPVTLADKLKQKYTLAFERDSLDRTLNQITQDTGIPIKILGGDLQLDGITQNQSFGLDEKDKPVFEILKIILKKANQDGKLIYVIKKENGEEMLFITTRAAAAKRGDAIPPELK